MLSNDFKPRRRCVFTSAGDHNVVSTWISKAERRSWDLIVAYYGECEKKYDETKRLADVIVKIKGSKFQNLKKIYSKQPGIFAKYDYVWVADDDLVIDSKDIEKLFDYTQLYDMWVTQPSFSPAGRISYPITKNSSLGGGMRIVNFVEVTCPLFKRDKLESFLSVYDGELVGWGIDWWYCNHFNAQSVRKFAVIDEVSVVNPHDENRPGKRREISNLQSDRERMLAWRETASNFGLREYKMAEFCTLLLPETESNTPQDLQGNMKSGNISIRMEQNEAEEFRNQIDPSGDYLEWGIGGSTFEALNHTTGKVVSIESDPDWAKHVEKNTTIIEQKKAGRYSCLNIDIGAVGEWGFPKNRDNIDRWPTYVAAPWRITDFKPKTILIDGRFRTACALLSLLLSQHDTTIMLHDFDDGMPQRENYKIVLKYADCVSKAGTLIVLKRKRDFDRFTATLDLLQSVNSVW